MKLRPPRAFPARAAAASGARHNSLSRSHLAKLCLRMSRNVSRGGLWHLSDFCFNRVFWSPLRLLIPEIVIVRLSRFRLGAFQRGRLLFVHGVRAAIAAEVECRRESPV